MECRAWQRAERVPFRRRRPIRCAPLPGMKLATTVELTVNGTQLNVTFPARARGGQAGAGAVGFFLPWPLAVTAGIGAYKQKKAAERDFEVVYRCTMGEPTSFRRRAQMRRRQKPGGSLSAVRGADLCKCEVLQRLRRKATNGVCPAAARRVKPGSKFFCSECGQALSPDLS